MDKQRKLARRRARRGFHVRRMLKLHAKRPRLSVFRSLKHISAQVIDDDRGVTIAAASTMQKDVAEGLSSTSNKSAAERVGQLLAERAQAAGVKQVAFDRGTLKYHGCVAVLADAARKGGLEF